MGDGHEDMVACLMDVGDIEHCGECPWGHNHQGICKSDDGPLASQTDDTIYGFNGQAIIF
jgi:hypothetical protein